jgi:hypothetical protein
MAGESDKNKKDQYSSHKKELSILALAGKRYSKIWKKE